MNKNWILTIFLAIFLFLSGCGGGASGGSSTGKDNGTSDNNGNNTTPSSHFKYSRISIAGSSITHGQSEGYLGEKSYVGYVERYFREEVASTIGPDNLQGEDRSYKEPMSYQGLIKVYNAGKVLTGTLSASNEIAIAYAGTDVKTTIILEVDGKSYTYTIPSGKYAPEKKVFDDTTVDFYKAFRQTNEKAVKIWRLDSFKEHTFTLKVLEGELHLNLITNHMYFMQNAGDSGFEAADFLSEYREHSTVKDIIAFKPDLFLFESATNDAKTWKNELQGKESTNDWIIEEPVPFTSNGLKLLLNDNINVQAGDVVVIGEYNGDIQNMMVGIVGETSDTNAISLSKLVSYDNQEIKEVNAIPRNIVKKCRIKRVRVWEDRVKEVIRRVKAGVGQNITVGIATSGVPNYYYPYSADLPHVEGIEDDTNSPRRLLGYREKGKILAEENGWFFVDFFQKILSIQPGVDINREWSIGDNTHPNELGRPYFGEAVIKALPK